MRLIIIRSGGACWNVSAFIQGRCAALAVANVRDQAARELVGVALALLEADAADGEAVA